MITNMDMKTRYDLQKLVEDLMITDEDDLRSQLYLIDRFEAVNNVEICRDNILDEVDRLRKKR